MEARLKSENEAFIDGQNLHMNIKLQGWKVDLSRFRIYLKEKYLVTHAYYFLGVFDESNNNVYSAIQNAGFILVFREHSKIMTGKKKGNVDTDIVFEVMRKLVENEVFNNIVLVSGDGDYFKMVQYLIYKNRFAKLLAPSKKSMSSLYNPLPTKFTDHLDSLDIKRKIATR